MCSWAWVQGARQGGRVARGTATQPRTSSQHAGGMRGWAPRPSRAAHAHPGAQAECQPQGGFHLQPSHGLQQRRHLARHPASEAPHAWAIQHSLWCIAPPRRGGMQPQLRCCAPSCGFAGREGWGLWSGRGVALRSMHASSCRCPSPASSPSTCLHLRAASLSLSELRLEPARERHCGGCGRQHRRPAVGVAAHLFRHEGHSFRPVRGQKGASGQGARPGLGGVAGYLASAGCASTAPPIHCPLPASISPGSCGRLPVPRCLDRSAIHLPLAPIPPPAPR